MNTHTIYAAAPGEQLGVQCLAQGHLSRGIEGGKSAVHSLPPPTIPGIGEQVEGEKMMTEFLFSGELSL